MSRRLAVIALLAVSILAARSARAQCSVSLSAATQPGQANLHADASGVNNGSTPMSLDVQLDGERLSNGTTTCSLTSCTFDYVYDTYCEPPGLTHTLTGSCQVLSPYSFNDGTTTFQVVAGPPPTITASYSGQDLTYSWTSDPHWTAGNGLGIFTDGSTTPYWSGGVGASGSNYMAITFPSCTGAHTIDVKIASCSKYFDTPPWTATTRVTVPDPGQPKVFISVVPESGDPTKFDAVVGYHFPSSGTRTLMVKLLKKPGDADGATLAGPLSPANTDGQLDPIPLPYTSDELYVAAFATSSVCNITKKAVAGFKSCCGQTTPPGWVGTPIDLVTGTMRMSDTDPLPSTVLPLTRSYDSANTTRGVFGTGWTSYLDAALALDGTGNSQIVVVNTEANNRYAFTLEGGAYTQLWPTSSETPSVFGGNPTNGFTFREAGSDITRSFDPSGRVTAISSARQNRSLTISYDGSGHVARVDDSYGIVSLLLTTDSTGLVTRIDVSGRPDIFWTYQYSSNLLTGVTAPDGHAWRTYQYTGGLLTAALDPLGNTLESHTYDAAGRAISSSQSTNDIQNIEHLAGRTSNEVLTRVTYASGKVSQYYAQSAGSSMITADVFGGCSSCSSEDGTYVFDASGHVIKKQDARGYITQYTYAGSALSSIVSPLKPPACDPQTDTAHCRLSVAALTAATPETTPLSLVTTYAYGNANWPDKPTLITTTSVANGSGTRQESLTYDVATGEVLVRSVTGWVSPTQSETHTTTTTLYNGSEGAAFTPGGPFDSSWVTLAQPANLRKSVDGPRTDVSDVTQFVYYPFDASVPVNLRGKLAAVRDALGHITTYSAYDVFGNAGTVTDPNGVVTNMTYDTLGRLLTTTAPAISGCDTTADPTCNTAIVSSRTYSAGGGPLATETRPLGGVASYTYDGRGRVASMTRTISSTVSERMEYDYDPATGQKSAERTLDNSSGSFVVRKSASYSYDGEGHLTQVLYPDNAKALYTYDIAGALSTAQDENHSSANSFYDYNEAGRIRAVRQTLGTSQIATSYAYDAQGNLVSVTDPNGNVTSYTYDDFGRMTQQVSPVTGTSTYTYDVAGNLLTTTDANAATTTRTYDALSRPLSAISALSGSPSETVSWSYDDPTAFSYGIGRLTGTTDPTGATTFRYDHLGRLRYEQKTLGGAAYVSAYVYDTDGNRTSLTYPSGRIVTYTYDLAGRQLSAASGGTTLASSGAYLPFGPLTGFTFGNGLKKAMSYDSRYRLTDNKLFQPPNNIARYSYSYDPTGNITGIQDVMDATYSRTFGYDDLNRLVTANTGTSLWRSGSYAYDAMGNLTSRSLGVPPVDDGTVLSLPGRHLRATATVTGQVDRLSFTLQATTPKISVVTSNGLDHTVSYDAAGNETGYFASRTYSPRNLMSTVTDTSGEGPAHQITYGYDYRGVRVSRTESPTDAGSASRYYFYAPELQLLSSTVDDSNNVWGQSTHIMSTPLVMNREVVWFAGQPVAEYGPPRTPDAVTPLSVHHTSDTNTPANNLFYTFTDHLGTPLIQTDPSTAIVWRAEHEPYGSVYLMRKGSRTDQPLRFPGQEAAMTWEGTEENYNVFRWYQAGWGRYTQPDPIGLGNLSAYLYADAVPIRSADPYGLYKTLKSYDYKPSPDPTQICGSPFACSLVGIAITCTCHCSGAGYFADATVHEGGTIYYFSGPFAAIKKKPKDKTVKDKDSAIVHEFKWHIDPAFETVEGWIIGLENTPHPTEQSCKDDCAAVNLQVIGAFNSALKQTMINENK